jgi:hypothetical protein
MNDKLINTSTGEITASGSFESFLSNYTERLQVAEMLLKSGLLPKAYEQPEQVLAVMLTAHELSIPFMMALRTIDIIQGQPTLSPELMLALIQRTGELEKRTIEDDGQTCTVTMKRRGMDAHSESFGMEDAGRMLTSEWRDKVKVTIKLSEKHNWKSQPKTMRKWRAIGACARVVFPDVLGGMYLREEIQDVIDDPVVAEVIHEDEPHVEKPAPVEVAAGVNLPTFDPRSERITFGKYGPGADSQGMFWSELPPDYVAWLANSAKKPTDREKATATIAFMDAQAGQVKDVSQESVVDEMFGKDPAVAKSAELRGNILAFIETASAKELEESAKRVGELAAAGDLIEAHAIELGLIIKNKQEAAK